MVISPRERWRGAADGIVPGADAFRNRGAPRGGGRTLSARPLVLDGEVAVFDEQLRSRFEWLREPDPAAVASPPLFIGLLKEQ
jgi:hypothetical protein